MRTRSRSVRAILLSLTLAACGGGANPYQGLDAEGLFRLATQEFEEGDYENAIEALDRLILSSGDFERLPEARLLLARAYYENGDYLTARSEYVRFLDRYSGHPRAAEAALGVCKSLAALSPAVPRDQSFTQDAILVCRNTVIDYAGTPQAVEAAEIANRMRLKLAEKEYRTGEYYCRRKFWDAAIKYYQFTVNLYAETEFAPRALLGIYYANRQIGYDDEAEAAKERLLSEYPDSQAAAELRQNGTGSC